MQVVAKYTNLRISARKVRLVADTIRGKHVDEALAILRFLPQGSAPHMTKLVKSAIANADNNFQLSPEDLYVTKVLVDEGPTMKRMSARARGRGDRILKRSCHITVVVDDREEV